MVIVPVRSLYPPPLPFPLPLPFPFPFSFPFPLPSSPPPQAAKEKMEVINQFQKEVLGDLEGMVSNVFTARLKDLENKGKI